MRLTSENIHEFLTKSGTTVPFYKASQNGVVACHIGNYWEAIPNFENSGFTGNGHLGIMEGRVFTEVFPGTSRNSGLFSTEDAYFTSLTEAKAHSRQLVLTYIDRLNATLFVGCEIYTCDCPIID